MKNLKAARQQKRLTQQEVADRLNVNRVTYARYEAGTYEPDIGTSIRLADMLDCSIDYLVGREPQEQTPAPDTIAAHTDAPMTPEMENRIQELAAEVFKRLSQEK